MSIKNHFNGFLIVFFSFSRIFCFSLAFHDSLLRSSHRDCSRAAHLIWVHVVIHNEPLEEVLFQFNVRRFRKSSALAVSSWTFS